MIDVTRRLHQLAPSLRLFLRSVSAMAIFRQLAGRNTRRGSGKRLGPRAELGAIRQVPSQQSAALDQAEESTSFSARSLSLLLCSNVRGSISKNEDFAPATKPQAPPVTASLSVLTVPTTGRAAQARLWIVPQVNQNYSGGFRFGGVWLCLAQFITALTVALAVNIGQ